LKDILRKVFGPIQCKERWRMRSNNTLKKLIKGEHTVNCMKAQGIRQWEHVQRMDVPAALVKGT